MFNAHLNGYFIKHNYSVREKEHFEKNSLNSTSGNINAIKTIVYTVSVCDKISKFEPRLYWSYLPGMPGMPLEYFIMKRTFDCTRLLIWSLPTDQHLLEAIKPFKIHRKDLPNVRNEKPNAHLNGR